LKQNKQYAVAAKKNPCICNNVSFFFILQDDMKDEEKERKKRRKDHQTKKQKLATADPTPTSWVCETCGEESTTRTNLENHIRQCHPPRTAEPTGRNDPKFKCDQCKKRCTTRAQLAHHVYDCHSKKTYTCTICNEDFGNNRGRLRYHKEKFHNNGAGLPELVTRPFQRVAQVTSPNPPQTASWTESDDPVSHWTRDPEPSTEAIPTSSPKAQRKKSRKRAAVRPSDQ